MTCVRSIHRDLVWTPWTLASRKHLGRSRTSRSQARSRMASSTCTGGIARELHKYLPYLLFFLTSCKRCRRFDAKDDPSYTMSFPRTPLRLGELATSLPRGRQSPGTDPPPWDWRPGSRPKNCARTSPWGPFTKPTCLRISHHLRARGLRLARSTCPSRHGRRQLKIWTRTWVL